MGGRLDYATTSSIENNTNTDLKWIEEVNEPITIVGLTKQNLLYIWRELDPAWKCLNWSGGKQLQVVDFDLHKHGVIIVTNRGLCYRASFKPNTAKSNQQAQINTPQQKVASSSVPAFGSAPIIIHTETMDVDRVGFVTRCSKVFCDLKGRNFFALQNSPTVNMRYHPEKMPSSFRECMREFYEQTVTMERGDEKSDCDDDIHEMMLANLSSSFSDCVLLFKDHRFKVHKYILASRGF